MLKFFDGQRVTDGRDSILVSNFTEMGREVYVWRYDEYGKWECDYVSEITTVTG